MHDIIRTLPLTSLLLVNRQYSLKSLSFSSQSKEWEADKQGLAESLGANSIGYAVNEL